MTRQTSWLSRFAGAATLALAVSAACAQATAPAAISASGPAPVTATTSAAHAAADFSSPVATLQTMLAAIRHNDFATVRGAMIIPAAQANDINALLNTMEAVGKLQQAAAAKFLDAGDKAFSTPTPATLAAQLTQIANSVVVIRNQDATISLPANADLKTPGGDIALKLIGGDWKVDGAAFFKLNTEPAATTAQRVALAKKVTAISQAMGTEIAAGKYFSASDAYIEYWTRCQAASK